MLKTDVNIKVTNTKILCLWFTNDINIYFKNVFGLPTSLIYYVIIKLIF